MTDARIEELLARDEIRQLAYRYAHAVDTRDLDLLVSLFVRDVQVGPRVGHEALREFWDRSLRAVGVTVLFVGNHLVDVVDADHATGLVYCRGYLQAGDRFVEQAIRYSDTYRREDGAWRFVRRVHELWYGVETAERPLDQPPARWPASSVGVGTLPYDLPEWRRFWGGGEAAPDTD
jgi:ketosteroid isomerase-like protein